MNGDQLVKGFFAYPSKPDISEILRNAVGQINACQVVNIKTWEECKVGGKFVIQEICREIDAAAIFCADLTHINQNVMFELGYAIGRNKRIWLAVDTSLTETKNDLAKLKILTTIGQSSYSNSNEIARKFLNDRPYEDLSSTIFNSGIRPNLPNAPHETIFYLKSRHATEASTFISKELAKASNATALALIIDDPRETSVQPLAWYGEQVYSAICVVCHLINPAREGAHLHNARYSFAAGLAFGMDKKLLMLAQGDFVAPLDYRDLLKHYQTGSEAEGHLHRWLLPIIEDRKRATQSQDSYISAVRLAQELAGLRIGEPIAENESERLVHEYFVETAAYREALEGRQAIFVGRKGAGKTANFLKLSTTLGSDRRNLVCVIKPLAYEMQGILELLSRYRDASIKGYAIESMWKFLIYSEIALATEAAINVRASGLVYEKEKDLIAMLDQNAQMLRQDFSIRLERCVASLLSASPVGSQDTMESNRLAIAQALHSGLLRKLREALVHALGEKQKVAILVDNLDKAWDKQSDIENLSEFLLGLLSAVTRVSSDFKNVGMQRKTLNVSLAVFVRSDIFYRVMNIAREPDKIVHARITWSDPEMLIRLVEERFSSSLGIPPNEAWAKYFCPTVRELPTKSYFVSRVLKRPRDLLFFMKAAISTAVNRRHAKVEEKDVLDAEKQYSQFAVDSILVENGISIKELENIIYEFVGATAMLPDNEIIKILKRVAVPEEKMRHVINHLCILTFLGVEVNDGEFRFAEDYSEHQKNSVLAQKLTERKLKVPRYKINPAFWSFLEIPDEFELETN